MRDDARINLLTEFSRSRRVEGSRTLFDFDVTDYLDHEELDEFRRRTGLRRSPVTLVLPEGHGAIFRATNLQDRVVVAFLHGFGGSRGSWGRRDSALGARGLVADTLRSVENRGKEAIGVVLAGLGRDGANLDPTARRAGLTPEHYSRQLEYILYHLGLYDCGRIVGVGHSVGAAALWEFAGRGFSGIGGPGGQWGWRPELSVVSISPVRALAESDGLRLGCHVAGRGLDLLLRPLFHLWRSSSRRLWDLVGMASVLKGLARQEPFRASLAGIKGLVLIGERDWIARVGLSVGMQQANCEWPVAQLAGLGHNLLWHPATARALASHMPALL